MSGKASDKSLKDQIRWPLWGAIAFNVVGLYGIAHHEAVSATGVQGWIAGAGNLLPMAAALAVTTIANGLLSAGTKARLVFLRLRHALPGHRAFSRFAHSDPRIDVEALRKLLGKDWPTDPEAQNRTWYRFYKETENDPAVLHVHREFLFTRDLAGFAVLFIPTFGVVAGLVMPPVTCAIYVGLLVVQFWIARHAAATYGARMVCTVLARKAAKPVEARPQRARRGPKTTTA